MLSTDITDCYGSFYTHSLEWALHGKAATKAALGGGGSTLGRQLDAAVRNGQDGQTKGIPISPDTSLVLSEVILCAIDIELQHRHRDVHMRGIRYMDDLAYYASTQSEAEDILLSWQSLLAEYELSVNPLKTQIIEGPTTIEAPWRRRLLQFEFRGTKQKLVNDTYSFFSRAFELAGDNPGQPVLSYAISTANSQVGDDESWQAMQYMMLPAIMAEPSCLRFVAIALLERHGRGVPINGVELEATLNDVCEYHGKREHGSEVAWALWILRRLGLTLSPPAAESVSHMQDNCSLILLLDMLNAGLAPATNITSILARAEAADAFRSEDWLLGYECAAHKWSREASFRTQGHWAELLDQNVHFYRPSELAPGGGPVLSAGVSLSGSGVASVQSSEPDAAGGEDESSPVVGAKQYDLDASVDVSGMKYADQDPDGRSDQEDQEEGPDRERDKGERNASDQTDGSTGDYDEAEDDDDMGEDDDELEALAGGGDGYA